jgi:hypothetical protein
VVAQLPPKPGLFDQLRGKPRPSGQGIPTALYADLYSRFGGFLLRIAQGDNLVFADKLHAGAFTVAGQLIASQDKRSRCKISLGASYSATVSG